MVICEAALLSSARRWSAPHRALILQNSPTAVSRWCLGARGGGSCLCTSNASACRKLQVRQEIKAGMVTQQSGASPKAAQPSRHAALPPPPPPPVAVAAFRLRKCCRTIVASNGMPICAKNLHRTHVNSF